MTLLSTLETTISKHASKLDLRYENGYFIICVKFCEAGMEYGLRRICSDNLTLRSSSGEKMSCQTIGSYQNQRTIYHSLNFLLLCCW